MTRNQVLPARTGVRCFRRGDMGKRRHGVWVMTLPKQPWSNRGVFVHGDVDEMEAPEYSLTDLETFATKGGWFPCEEITPAEVLEELANWPEGQADIAGVLNCHLVTEKEGSCQDEKTKHH